MISIALIDDQPAIAQALAVLLEESGLGKIAGIYSDSREALQAICSAPTSVAIVDVSMPFLNGIDLTRELCRRCPGTRVIAVSAHSNSAYLSGMLAAGACGYILKENAALELVAAIRAVLTGDIWIGQGLEHSES